jgi:hypothetical protein
MGLIFPDPPQAPNPILTAGAQTAQNIGTAITGSYLNNYNQVTPTGSLTYDTTSRPAYPYTDPLTGQTYQVPQWTATQTLSPAGQRLQTTNEATTQTLADLGQYEATSLSDMLRDPSRSLASTYDFAPMAGTVPGANIPGTQYGWGDVGQQQRSLPDRGLQQTTFGEAGDITRSYGPEDDFSSDRQRVEESLYQRINPQLQQDRDRLRQQLADQGIQYGTEAYDRAIAAADRQTTDARLAVTAQGGQEQQRMMDMAAQRAGFQNAAQKQAYDQALGRGQFANQAQIEQFQKDVGSGTFANQAQKDAFTQEASRAQFNNAAQAQELARQNTQFNAQNTSRGNYLTEQAALRSAPINEILALQSGSQVQQPNFVNTGSNQIANTDVAGIINNRFSQDLDIYKQQTSNVNNIIGGLFGLAGSGAKAGAQVYTASDRRVKKNIHRVGTVFAARKHDEPKKLPIYSYEYKDRHEDNGAARHIGPMAQDMEKIDPGAVKTISGIKHIKTKRVLGDILRVA